MTDANQYPPYQAQSQVQNNSLMVTVQNSSDPGLERQIFNNVASAGRQLGRMADVVDLLIAAYERDPNNAQDPNSLDTINAFRSMRADIAKEKNARSPDRFIETLDSLRADDGNTYAALLPRLIQWVDNHRNDMPLGQ